MKLLELIRKEYGYTQYEVASLIRVNKTTLRRIEKDIPEYRKRQRYNVLLDLSELYNLTIDEVIENKELEDNNNV